MRIRDFLMVFGIKSKVADPVRPIEYATAKSTYGRARNIELQDVSFSYHKSDGPMAVRHLSNFIEAESLVCMVGTNGPGKVSFRDRMKAITESMTWSRLVKLLARLMDPSHGIMLVDGYPVDRYMQDDLHRFTVAQFQSLSASNLTIAAVLWLATASERPADPIDVGAVKTAIGRVDLTALIDSLDRGIWSRLGS